jgi:phospholipase/carboxylesterase
MALSTYLPLATVLPNEASPANRKTSIFMAHGVYDPVVPYLMGTTSKTTLGALGYDVEWHEYGMQHSVCAEEVRDIGTWLRRVLAA